MKTLFTPARPSSLLLRAAARFGLHVRRDAHTRPERTALRLAHYAPDAKRLEAALAPGRIVLVTGESGCGKSTVLELLARRLRLRKRNVRIVTDPLKKKRALKKPLVEQMRGGIDKRLRTLASCGLADATLLARSPEELSEGERARLAIAFAARNARRADTLICDEFAATLDRVTAMGLSFALAKWARREQVQVVVATGNDDIAAPLEALVFRIGEPTKPARCAA